jgi:hypothetical protein
MTAPYAVTSGQSKNAAAAVKMARERVQREIL